MWQIINQQLISHIDLWWGSVTAVVAAAASDNDDDDDINDDIADASVTDVSVAVFTSPNPLIWSVRRTPASSLTDSSTDDGPVMQLTGSHHGTNVSVCKLCERIPGRNHGKF